MQEHDSNSQVDAGGQAAAAGNAFAREPVQAPDGTHNDVLAVMGLREPPFGEQVSDVYFFPSQQHLRALGFIGQLLWSRANVAAITGVAGIGKSLLIRRLMSDLDERVLAAHVQNPPPDPQEFLREVLRQFGMELSPSDRSDRRRLLYRFLAHQFGQNRLCLLAVEGVHGLRPAVLEELRAIAEFEVDGKRVIKLLLMGSQALVRIIDSPRMVSLCVGRAPRVTIEAFSEDQMAAYVAHRLRASGALDPDAIVSPTLTPYLHRYSAGVPRLINQLCENALAIAIEMGEVRLTETAVMRAAEALHIIPTAERIEALIDSQPGQAEDELAQQAVLLISTQGAGDSVVPLLSARMLIGRSELAEVHIDSTFVSRYHALIVRERGQDLLLDLGSTNGILVNGKRVVRAVLRHRDLIQIVPARITYLNPAIAPPEATDGSETVNFARPGEANDADASLIAFGHFDSAS